MKTVIPNTRRALALLSLSLTQTVLFTTPGHCADVTSSKFESKFYKEHPLFSTYPKETAARTEVEHFGPVGIGLNLVLPPFQMQVSRVHKDSPAEATGKLKVGLWIETINGEILKDIDPRIQLGAITADAVAYYTDLVGRYGKQAFKRYTEPSSRLDYHAGAQFHKEFKLGDKTFSNVHVVTLKLTFDQNFAATGTEGMHFQKDRVVILDAGGRVLHISGDGPTEVPILAI